MALDFPGTMIWRSLPAAALALMLPAAARAADPETGQADQAVEGDGSGGLLQVDFSDIIESGGVMMYPLAALSLVAVVLILLFLLTIRRNAVVSDRFMNTAEAMIRKRDFVGLIGYCHRRNECIARVTQQSLEFLTKNERVSFSEVREVAESEGSRQAGILGSRITYLADIGSIAPMVGLLGTVLGMIKSFLEISSGNVEVVKQMKLAGGVSEALVTTATGLAIGIPALAFYSIFRGRVQKYISELEAATTHLMAMLHAQIRLQGQHPAHAAAARPVPPDPLGPTEGYTASPLAEQRPDLHGI